MNTFDRIVLIIASGPGIASPNIDRYEVARSNIDEADAHHADRLIDEAGFFELGDFVPKIKIFDGPHKSHITVELTDGRSHSVAYAGMELPGSLQAVINFTLRHGTS